MDLQVITTLGLGTAAITLVFAASKCISRGLWEASHGAFKNALMWTAAFGVSTHAALYTGILTLTKGIETARTNRATEPTRTPGRPWPGSARTTAPRATSSRGRRRRRPSG